MHALVTGAAGFIGSHLAEALVDLGVAVRGVDCFTDYYSIEQKRQNLAALIDHSRFELRESDLRHADLALLLDGIDHVFHQAGQPGVRTSWSTHFPDYADHNILVTQRLLEAARFTQLRRFVFASSSSVYGDPERFPTVESDLPAPRSPYGVTKLAAEHLCGLYASNFGVPTVVLRYFTVYGPRQRPDMAFHRMFEGQLEGSAFPLYGDGTQIRDFTYVSDVVAANLAAADRGESLEGSVVNVAGESSVSMHELFDLVCSIAGSPLRIRTEPALPGDVLRTGGSIAKATEHLGWRPQVSLSTVWPSNWPGTDGVAHDVALSRYSALNRPGLTGGSDLTRETEPCLHPGSTTRRPATGP